MTLLAAHPVPAAARRLDRPAQAALLLGAAGVAYRVGLVLSDAPPTNSDEATMGLGALHIAEGREFPAFFYGQAYMGTLEAYLAAPLVRLLGPSTVVLRLPVLALYAVFVFLAYRLARRLYTPWLAVVTVAVLALGSDRVIKNQLIAAGGYPEISPLAALLFLLALAARPGVVTAAAFGLVAGLLLWDDWLILPYLAAAGVILLLRSPRLLLVAVPAAAVGAAPLLARLPDALAEVGTLNEGGGGVHLYGGVLFGVPMGTGLCSPSDCLPWQMWWGPVYPVLLVAAAVLGVRAYRATPDPAQRLRQVGRLALVAAAALTLIGYARSAAAGETPVESARYLSPLLISTPAVLWPLWTVRPARHAVATLLTRSAAAALLARSAVAALLATMLVASVALVAHAPVYGRRADRQRELMAALDRLDVTRVHSEYWTCNLITFASGERVICAVVADDLRPGQDRYLPYRHAVAAEPRPAYVAPVGSPLDARLGTSGPPAATSPGYHIY